MGRRNILKAGKLRGGGNFQGKIVRIRQRGLALPPNILQIYTFWNFGKICEENLLKFRIFAYNCYFSRKQLKISNGWNE